jgi:hypothetical protein
VTVFTSYDTLAISSGRTPHTWTHLLILAGGGNGTPLDYTELERWTRVGYEPGMRWREGKRRNCLRGEMREARGRARGFRVNALSG